MPLNDLQNQLLLAEQDVEECKRKFLDKKKELYRIEDDLILAKEKLLKVVEEIRQFNLSKDMSSIIDEVRAIEIRVLKLKIPSLLQIIEHEKPLKKV